MVAFTPIPVELDLLTGQSLCLVFDNETEQQEIVHTFLRLGVSKGHRVIYLISEIQESERLGYLRPRDGAGKTTGRLGQLRILPVEEIFEPIGLNGSKFSQWLMEENRQAQQDGFSGLSLTVEMDWTASGYSPAQLLAFETNLSAGLADSPILALTLYDRRIIPPQTLMHVLTAHPSVIHDGKIKHNPFHVPMGFDAAQDALQNWLDHLELLTSPEFLVPESDTQLRMIFASMPVVVFALNRQGVFTLSEGKGLQTLGLQPGEVVGMNVRQVFPSVDEIGIILERGLNGDTFSLEVQLNGSVFETHCSPILNLAGKIEGVLGVAVDITDRKQAEEDLRASEERYRHLVENQGEGVGIFGVDGQVLYINQAAEGILGRPVDELMGKNIGDFVPPDQKPIFAQQIAKRKTGQSSTYEVAFLHKDGRRRQVLVTATPRFDADGNYLGSFSVFRDITDRKHMEDRLRFQSNHDALTGLFNRFYFDEELEQINRNRHTPASVIVVDVDNMKETNDNQGHLKGDELLRRVARLLRSSFRSEDVVARIGGDEFAVLLPESDQRALDRSMERLRRNLEEINKQKNKVPLRISIGGASAEVGQSLMKTFDLADQRMYQEKYARKKIV